MIFEMARTTQLFIKGFSKIMCHFVLKKDPIFLYMKRNLINLIITKILMNEKWT